MRTKKRKGEKWDMDGEDLEIVFNLPFVFIFFSFYLKFGFYERWRRQTGSSGA
jgi:hypothetical protein